MPTRIAFVCGTLAQGGAEKQLVYMARALRADGADVRVFCLTRGEHHERALVDGGVTVEWIGRHPSPAWRVLALVAALRRFRPSVVQASHFYVNLYAALAARAVGAVALAAGRGDVAHDLAETGRWGPFLLRAGDALVVNSARARRDAVALGRTASTVHVLPNVIDLGAFDAALGARGTVGESEGTVRVVGIGRFKAAKRFDRFLRVLAAARAAGAPVVGCLVGDGPEEAATRALAERLGVADAVRFAGRQDEVAPWLRGDAVLLLTSDHEGLPNVVLEGMAASLPVVATDVGDVRELVAEGRSGYVAAPGAEAVLADRLVRLAHDRALRLALGAAGRRHVEAHHDVRGLGARLAELHGAVRRSRTAGAGDRSPAGPVASAPPATPLAGAADVPTLDASTPGASRSA